MPRSALFVTLFSATLLLPSLAFAGCGASHANACKDGTSWSASEGKCVPKVGS